MTYDLIIVGDGIMAKALFYEISRRVNKSQNFTLAKVYSEEIAPNCSIRTTSTVSLNGIVEGVSGLGDLLSQAFFSFEEFYKINKSINCGIYPSKQYLGSTDNEELLKLERRYRSLDEIIHPDLKKKIKGKVLDSYIVKPEELFSFFDNVSSKLKIDTYLNFVSDLKETDSGVELHFKNKEMIKAKKVILCTGAYASLYSHFMGHYEKVSKSKIVAGTYLYKKINLNRDSFYFTINGHNFVYRSHSNELIIGSTTVQGPVLVPEINILKDIYDCAKDYLSFELPLFSDFEMITGLRSKGQKRMPFCDYLNNSKTIYMINGLYKNGFSLPFYYNKKAVDEIVESFSND